MIHLRCGALEIDWGKNYGFADHRPLFQSTDISTAGYRYVDDDGSDLTVEQEASVRPLHLVAPRLRLLGITSTSAAKDAVEGMVEHDYLHEGLAPPTPDDVLAAFASLRIDELGLEDVFSPRLVIAAKAIPEEDNRRRIEAALEHVSPWDLFAAT